MTEQPAEGLYEALLTPALRDGVQATLPRAELVGRLQAMLDG